MGYRQGWRSTWFGKLDDSAKCIVEKIARRYDASWRAGTLDDGNLNSYCEGMVDAAAMCTDATEWEIRRAVGEYCAQCGLMLDYSKRPAWLDEHIGFVKELWEREDAEHARMGFSDKPICASRRKLMEELRGKGFQVSGGPNAVRQWVLTMDGSPAVNILVHAHRDGRRADYTICNRSWVPIQ